MATKKTATKKKVATKAVKKTPAKNVTKKTVAKKTVAKKARVSRPKAKKTTARKTTRRPAKRAKKAAEKKPKSDGPKRLTGKIEEAKRAKKEELNTDMLDKHEGKGKKSVASIKRKYLGMKKGRTLTGEKAHQIEIDPEIKDGKT